MLRVYCAYYISHNTALWAEMNVFSNKNADSLRVILWNTKSIPQVEITAIQHSNYFGFRLGLACFYEIQLKTAL
jgi:hypothetical protein